VNSTHTSSHEAAIAEERARCGICHGTGIQTDFIVSGMRVIAPCSCPRGGVETTICEIGNPRASAERDPSRHRRASNIAGRPKSNADYWQRVSLPDEVLATLRY
jgi:hypothetical protein